MPDAAQFTLGLFDNTALGWTVPVPVQDDDDNDSDTAEPVNTPTRPARNVPAVNYVLPGDRDLARGWPSRARANIDAIRLSKQIEDEGRRATPEEQAQLIRYVAFGATDLAQSAFVAPGESGFRPGWEQIGSELQESVTAIEYAALQRVTQYAHYTAESIVRAIWRTAHPAFDPRPSRDPANGRPRVAGAGPPTVPA